jgi:hypothetical protein
MTEQETKMQLLSICGGDIKTAREAYKFVTEKSVPGHRYVNGEKGTQDGVYIVYEDGYIAYFDGNNSKEGVSYVGLKFDGHSIKVALKDAGYCRLVEGDSEKDKSWDYKDREWKAVEDWNGLANTEHLRKNGLNPEIKLKAGEYIPASGQQLFMDKHLKKLNEALLYVGGEPIKTDEWYWSSSEFSSNYAWMFYFSNGQVGNGSKCISYYVRAVTAFF